MYLGFSDCFLHGTLTLDFYYLFLFLIIYDAVLRQHQYYGRRLLGGPLYGSLLGVLDLTLITIYHFERWFSTFLFFYESMAPVALPEKYIFKYSCPKTELNKTLFNFEKITKDQETKKNLDNYNPTKGISRTI